MKWEKVSAFYMGTVHAPAYVQAYSRVALRLSLGNCLPLLDVVLIALTSVVTLLRLAKNCNRNYHGSEPSRQTKVSKGLLI